MFRKIIVGFDGSPQAEDALALGKLIADATQASLTLAGVFYFSRRLGGRDPVLHDVEADHVRQLQEAAAAVGGEAETLSASSPAHGLHQLAEDTDADLVVIGSAHHGKAGQILAGSVGMSLLHGSPCSVAIAPRGYVDQAPEDITEIIVGFDGSTESALALEDAVHLGQATGARLKVMTVAEPPPIMYGKGGGPNYAWEALKDDIKQMMREQLDQAAAAVPDDLSLEPVLAEGAPDVALAEGAVEDGALLMVGSRGYGPLRGVLLGSVSTALVRSAPCPLIVHPRPAKVQEPTAEPAKAATAG